MTEEERISALDTLRSEDDAQHALGEHLDHIRSWSTTQHTIIDGARVNPLARYIPLNIQSQPKRTGDSGKSIDGEEIYSNDTSYLVVGSAGSGKTTMMKRIAYMALKDYEVSNRSRIPIVIVLRHYNDLQSLTAMINKIIGTSTRVLKENPQAGAEFHLRNMLGSRRIMLLLDGLDEIEPQLRARVMDEVSELVSMVSSIKVLASSRPGETNSISGLNTVEICPLSRSQVSALSEIYLEDSDRFLLLLSESVWMENLASSPLMLNSLLGIYRAVGHLPNRPLELYEESLNLMLGEWDRRKGVYRRSKFRAFSMVEKMNFLSYLSYQLMKDIGMSEFTSEEFHRIYIGGCSTFDLPIGEAKSVLDEIEQDTGVLVEDRQEVYRFVHLSMQEYLAARYLIGLPSWPNVNFLLNIPSVLAVATAMSSNPTLYFVELISRSLKFDGVTYSFYETLLNRILVEKPHFVASKDLENAFAKIEAIGLPSDSLLKDLKKVTLS
ncbi:NACHT domain-containing protein [Granulosicoccus sp.]|nr:NACHT domain-containing protein [Granulosicoccus sp.]